MKVDTIKDIANYRAIAEATKLMLDEFDSLSISSLREIKCHASPAGIPDGRMASIIEKRDRVRRELTDNYQAYLDAVELGLAELEAIEDYKMRTILILRYVKCYRWEQIAKHLGGMATADSIKKYAERFLAANVLGSGGGACSEAI